MQISYVQNILAAVRGNLTIDNTRIYAAGFSNGGGFVNLLACTPNMAPTFAAFATSSPALYSGTRSVSGCDSGGHPVALIDFHGLADDQIPYAGRTSLGGDTSYALPDIDDWRQQWAERAGCGVPSSGSRVAPSVMTTNYLSQNTTSYRWNCARATIIGYTVQTMGHWWLTAGGETVFRVDHVNKTDRLHRWVLG
jgi:poly(3-hydroxybutyrate) depolymerase